MSGQPGPIATMGVSCARCIADATPSAFFAAPGALAGHLAERHGVSASRALSDARAAFDNPAPHPAPRALPAPILEAPMPNKTGKKKCGNCGTPGHQASTCKRTAAAKAPAKPGPQTRPITGAVERDVAAAKGRESAREVIQQKIREELAWARSYVAELEKLAGEA